LFTHPHNKPPRAPRPASARSASNIPYSAPPAPPPSSLNGIGLGS
jgi:hypothetical protein